MNKKIQGVYKITNKITGDFYIGSSKDIGYRWSQHKCAYNWKRHPNSLLYKDFQKYGLENFSFEVIEETTNLREREQYFIDLLNPKYNNYFAKGRSIERAQKRRQSEKGRNSNKEATKKYRNHICLYEGEELTFGALINRFIRRGIPHATIEAKKYQIQ